MRNPINSEQPKFSKNKKRQKFKNKDAERAKIPKMSKN